MNEGNYDSCWTNIDCVLILYLFIGLERTSDVNVIEDDERDNCALFLGDLSIFCDEKDIEGAFSTFGEIVDIRIQRSKETSRALSYGFIEFADPNAATAALANMNYYLLKGRPLR